MKEYFGSTYRYFDVYGAIITLKDMSLRFTRYDSLNDPLDGSSLIINDSISVNAEKEVLRILRQEAFNSFPTSIKNRRKFISVGKASISQSKKTPNVQIYQFNKNYYTCCFSKYYSNPDSFLLWSYYADKHHGVCIEFCFDEFKLKPKEVYYTSKIEKLSLNINYRETIPSSELNKFLIQKQICWKHENEIRLIGREEFFKEKKINYRLSSDKVNLYINLEKEYIKKVVFGSSTSQKEIDDIVQLLNNLDVEKDIYIEQMYIDENTLELKAKPYERL